MVPNITAKPVAFILKGYPRLSETFIAQEIEALERRGLDIRIISLRHPTDRAVHPVHQRINAPVNYLPEYLYQEPLRVWRAWKLVRQLPGYRTARALWLGDLRRDRSPNRIRRFGQALVLAAELGDEVRHLHAHFLHTPASVARYAAHMTARRWSCSAHAKDIWTTTQWEKQEKLADLDWLVTCSQAAHDDLAALAPQNEASNKEIGNGHGDVQGTVELVYHGIDLTHFAPPPTTCADRDGRNEADPVQILSVGRAVSKKGYDDLIAALAALPPALHWRLVHIGGGNLLEKLQQQAKQAGIADRITWRGAQPQDAVLAAYRDADIFVLASRIAGDGDRDGLPNVLMEAQSQGLACVATAVSAIPELITHGETGILVQGRDRVELSQAMASLIGEPARRRQLGQAGQARVRDGFSHDFWIERLARKFDLPEFAASEVETGAAVGPGTAARNT
jgi:glycosyltransferase involved in cell wall biosynthesis